MKTLRDITIGLIIGFAVCWIIKPERTVTVDRTVYEYDTIYIPKPYKEIVHNTVIDTLFKTDTVRIVEKCKEVVTDYYTERNYNDTIKIPVGYVAVEQTVYENKLTSFGYRYSIEIPSDDGIFLGGALGYKSVGAMIAYKRDKFIYHGTIGNDGVKIGLIYKIK